MPKAAPVDALSLDASAMSLDSDDDDPKPPGAAGVPPPTPAGPAGTAAGAGAGANTTAPGGPATGAPGDAGAAAAAGDTKAAADVKVDPWRLLEGNDLKQPLEALQLDGKAGLQLLVERRDAEGKWPRARFIRDWRDFRVGDIIDAQDTVKKWYESTVLKVREDAIFVHFNGQCVGGGLCSRLSRLRGSCFCFCVACRLGRHVGLVAQEGCRDARQARHVLGALCGETSAL